MSGLSEKVPEDPPPDESNDDVRQNLIDLASGWWVSSSVRPSESNEFENQHKESNRAKMSTLLGSIRCAHNVSLQYLYG